MDILLNLDFDFDVKKLIKKQVKKQVKKELTKKFTKKLKKELKKEIKKQVKKRLKKVNNDKNAYICDDFVVDDNEEIQYKGAIYFPYEKEEIVDVMTETDVSDFDEDLLETDEDEVEDFYNYGVSKEMVEIPDEDSDSDFEEEDSDSDFEEEEEDSDSDFEEYDYKKHKKEKVVEKEDLDLEKYFKDWVSKLKKKNKSKDEEFKPMFSYKKYIEVKSNKLKCEEDSNSEFEKLDEDTDSDSDFEEYNYKKNKEENAIEALVGIAKSTKLEDESSEKYIDKVSKKVNKIVEDYESSDDFEHICCSDSDSDFVPHEYVKKDKNNNVILEDSGVEDNEGNGEGDILKDGYVSVEDFIGLTDKLRKKI